MKVSLAIAIFCALFGFYQTSAMNTIEYGDINNYQFIDRMFVYKAAADSKAVSKSESFPAVATFLFELLCEYEFHIIFSLRTGHFTQNTSSKASSKSMK